MKLKSLKRALSLVIILFITSIIGQIDKTTVKAANSINEIEPNDVYTNATMLPLNTPCNGTTKGFYDYDWYKITLPKAGKLDLIMNHDLLIGAGYSDSVYSIDLYANDGSTSFISVKSAGTDTTTQVPSMGVAAGTYYIRIRAEESQLISYKITAKFTETSLWEKEYNDTYSTASAIATGKTYSGSSSNYSDVDYYSFKITKAGLVSITFTHQNYMNSSRYYKIKIVNSKGTEFAEFESNGTDTKKSLSNLGLPAGTYYAVVDGDYNTPADVYKLNIGYKASTACETEYNDTTTTADTLKLGVKYTGATIQGDKDDKDYYKFSLSEPGYISLSFTHANYNSSNSYFSVMLYDSRVNELCEITSKGTDKTKSITALGLPKGTYYVLIDSSYYGDNKSYGLQVYNKKVKNYETEDNGAISAADPIKIGSTYSGRTIGKYEGGYDTDYYKFTLTKKSWMNISMTHKSTGNTSVQWYARLRDKEDHIIYENNGNHTYFDSEGTRKYTQSGNFLLDRGTYYIEVYGRVATTTYTINVSKVNIKAPTITKATSTSKSKVTLSWSRVAGAEKYYVYRSTSKNGKYKMIRSVNAGTYSITDASAKGKKTYYYKIKSMGTRKVNYTKKTTTSKFSAVKKVKAK